MLWHLFIYLFMGTKLQHQESAYCINLNNSDMLHAMQCILGVMVEFYYMTAPRIHYSMSPLFIVHLYAYS